MQQSDSSEDLFEVTLGNEQKIVNTMTATQENAYAYILEIFDQIWFDASHPFVTILVQNNMQLYISKAIERQMGDRATQIMFIINKIQGILRLNMLNSLLGQLHLIYEQLQKLVNYVRRMRGEKQLQVGLALRKNMFNQLMASKDLKFSQIADQSLEYLKEEDTKGLQQMINANNYEVQSLQSEYQWLIIPSQYLQDCNDAIEYRRKYQRRKHYKQKRKQEKTFKKLLADLKDWTPCPPTKQYEREIMNMLFVKKGSKKGVIDWNN